DYAIMVNIDFDHPDYFSNIDDVFDAFQSIADRVKKGLIAWGDDENLQRIQTKDQIIYYDYSESNDFQAHNIRETASSTEFDVYVRNTFYDSFTIPLYGNHHVLNALSVIAYCHYEGMESHVMKSLSTFTGVKRRFSEKVL